MNYEAYFRQQLEGLHREGRYRVFAHLERKAGAFPRAKRHNPGGPGEVTVWCSNDYLGMGQHPAVLAAMHEAIDSCGAGAGGTRKLPEPITIMCCWNASWPSCTARKPPICDFIRSFASGFIFTTSLPPAVAAGALASIRHLKASSEERARHQDRVARLRSRLNQAGVAHLDNPSHIVPVMVCDPVLCKQISDVLIDRYGIYVQPINYPTVPRGTERLRITPSPHHSDADIEHLVQALAEIWAEIGPAKAA
jgi:7-keto-8-aminopelargonate synthetase-like enzyme